MLSSSTWYEKALRLARTVESVAGLHDAAISTSTDCSWTSSPERVMLGDQPSPTEFDIQQSVIQAFYKQCVDAAETYKCGQGVCVGKLK